MSAASAITLAAALALVLGACGDDEPMATESQPTITAPTTTAAPETATPEQPDSEAQTEGDAEAESGEVEADETPAAPSNPEDAIRAVLTSAADPEQACTAFVTEEFVTQAYGGKANCVAARRPSALAQSVRISGEGDGSYTVVPSGGPYDGVEVAVEVVGSDGSFRVASLAADVPAGP